MTDRVRTLIKGRLYLRKRDVEKVLDTRDVINAFRIRAYEEMACKRCPNLDERFSREFCLPCESYHGRIDLAEEVRIDNKNYIAFPLGAKRMVERKLDIKIEVPKGHDLREYPQMRRKYKLTIELFDGTPAADGTTRINQKDAVDKWLKSGGVGVIRAGARSGKTVMAVGISVKLNLKTLVVTGSSDLLNQFWDTFCGDGSDRLCATDMPPERVIIINKMEDFLKPHDVALINYKKFIRETADARIETFIKGKYGLVIGDEVHNAAAQAYASFMLKLAIPLRLGLSATPKRKDGRYHIAEAVYGPVVVSLDKVGLKPKIFIRQTGRFPGRKQRAWHLLSKIWAIDEQRNAMIAEDAWAAIDRGHKAVLIPLDRTDHIDRIAELLNDEALRRHRKNRNLPEVVASIIDGRIPQGKPRKKALAEFDAPDSSFLFLIAQRSIVKEGIDLKRPSCVICPIPMSAVPSEGSPLFEQLSYRGSTAVHNKRDPEVIVYCDENEFTVTMISKLLKFEILRNAVEDVGDKRGLYYLDESCRTFTGGSTRESGSFGKMGGVVLRR